MINLYDIAYGVGVTAAAPYWLLKTKTRTKVLTAFRERFGQMTRRTSEAPAIWIHAVSLGEVNASRALIDALLAARAELDIVLSTTTATGHERAAKLYAGHARITLVRYPLDFSAAIERALDALRPSLVVLMELETWPNFIRHCQLRGIAVVLANGRITDHSFGRYKLIRPIVKRMLSRLTAICVQDQTYADRFFQLGAPREKIVVTGTMKYDSADVADSVAGDDELAAALQLNRADPILVCGSTGPGEEAIALRVYRELSKRFSALRLALIPRHPQRFDEVAALIESSGFDIVRRSRQSPIGSRQSEFPPVLLGDTMGELRKFYSLATVVFVGRSLVDLGSRQHGSDMIEPAALGKPCVVGPFTGNFDQTVRALVAADALVEVVDEADLLKQLSGLFADVSEARAMGSRAQHVVRQQQGSAARHLQIILQALK